jgi:protein involved in polysaccharide export with SLBB domain
MQIGCFHLNAALPPDGSLRSGKGGAKPKDVAFASSGECVLQVGDEIDIQVYREPELSGTFRINPSGEIRHSLAGTISMAGKTLEEAETYFAKCLAKDYLVNPRVIIKLLSTQSSQIVLLGEVKKPGVYPLPFGESTTLLQAIAGAGGFTDIASPDRVRIVRKTRDGHQTTLRVRVSDLLGGKGREQDVALEPNDVIMVPEVVF